MSSELPILLGGCFVAAFASGMAGFAFYLVAAGILFHWLPPQETAPVLVLGSLLIQLGTVRAVRRSIRWPVLRPYLIGGVLGTPFGVLILRVADASVIVTGIGMLLVGYSGYMLSRIALRRAPPVLRAGKVAAGAIGFAGGVLGGIGGFFGQESVMTLFAALPALGLGGWLGMRAYKVIPAAGFRVVLLGLLLLSGLSLVI